MLILFAIILLQYPNRRLDLEELRLGWDIVNNLIVSCQMEKIEGKLKSENVNIYHYCISKCFEVKRVQKRSLFANL